MEVFVTGGSGVLGRPVVRQLVCAGHHVRVAARSEANEIVIRQLGATPVRVDLFDASAVRGAVEGSRAVLHLASRIPASQEMRNARIWAENDRIRVAGTRHLVDAALETGVEAMLYPSVSLLYADQGASWLAEGAPVAPTPLTQANLVAEAELARFSGSGRRAIVLRMGGFYGPEAGHTRELLAYARKGVAGLVGRPDAYMSQVWVEDAASAVVAALERAPSGIFNVVEDVPATRAELVDALARAVGRRSLWRLPPFAARWLLGPVLLEQQGRSQRVSNRTFKEATGWVPSVASSREGFARLEQAMAARVAG